MGAYEKWGETCPEHLLGDFVFAIWDGKKQQFFCARDHVGIKPFYYHLDDEKFVFGNDIRCLVVDPNISKNINDEAVAIYLALGELWHPSLTFFETIQKLSPATSLTILKNSTVQITYWKAEDSPKITLGSFEEYAVKLHELLEDSVKKRLRSEKPIASHLSGGLDSSTIATIAARYLHLQDRSLQVYNWVPAPKEEDDPEYYEWANSKRIAELEKIEHHYVDLNDSKLSKILYYHDIAMNDTVDLSYEFLVREAAKKNNICTILSGWGGDELISYNGQAYYSDVVRQGKIFSALYDIYKKAKKKKRVWKHFFGICYFQVLVPNLPSWLHCYLPKVKCNTLNFLQCTNSHFRKRIKSKLVKTSLISKSNIRSDQLNAFNQGHLLNRIESWASSGFKERIEYCYPLLDKRIVEFALGIPAKMYLQDGKSRFLFRQSISGLLPEDIRWGNFKREVNRVNVLAQIEQNALKIWLKRFEKENRTKNLNSYINYALLKDQINLLDKMKWASFEERYMVIDTILKSIFVSNLGYEIKKGKN